MADERIAEFRSFFLTDYKRCFNVPYKWNYGKDDKLVKATIIYFEANYGESAMEKLYAACMNYFENKDEFYKDHEIGLFAQKPYKWIPKVEKRERPLPPPVEEVVKARTAPRPDRDMLVWLNEETRYGEKNAVSCVKGLVSSMEGQVEGTKEWRTKLSNLCIEVLGIDKCKQIGEEHRKNIRQKEQVM